MNYLSPELLNGTETPSLQTDLWGLSVLLFELATGQLPFPGNTANKVLESIENTKFLSILSCSIEFNSFINGLLRKNSKNKYD